MDETNTIPEFGIRREDEERRDGGVGIVFDPATQKYAVGKQSQDGLFRVFSGGIEQEEDIKEGTLREVREESGLHDFLFVEQTAEAFAHFYNNLRKINRMGKGTCFLIILNSPDLIETKLEEHEKFSLVWVTAEEILANWRERNENKDYDHWIYFLQKSVARAKELGYDTTSKVI
ncbi:MAG: NUDIX domain-containing protein [Candidatus Paceibacterota bacterium]|jgi:8-oxo-dGTP pyrophosphatase MutT (NUDIX family)